MDTYMRRKTTELYWQLMNVADMAEELGRVNLAGELRRRAEALKMEMSKQPKAVQS